MHLGSIAPPIPDFAYNDLGNRHERPLTPPGHGIDGNGAGRHDNGGRHPDAIRSAGPIYDTFRPTDRAARFLDHVPLHSAAPGAADRIVQALGGDNELIDKFLQTVELLEPFGPGLIRAFLKAVGRGIERAGEAAVPPEAPPAPSEPGAAGEFGVQLTRLDFRLEVFSASSELRSGPDGSSYTQNVQYASIQVSFLSLSVSGSFSQKIDPLRIAIEGDKISTAGLDLEAASTQGDAVAAASESSLAPGVRDAILDAASQISGILSNNQEHHAGADDPSPIVPRPPDGAPAVRDILHSLTEGFTPRIRLHL